MNNTRWLLARAGIVAAGAAGGCYSGIRAQDEINDAWRGRSVGELQADWGRGQVVDETPQVTTLAWRRVRQRVTRLPFAGGGLAIGPDHVEGYAEVQPGEVRRYVTEVVAFVDDKGVIQEVRGPSRRWWGPPNDENIHWGVLLGGHVGMGKLDDTATPLPSGGLYIGGMVSRYTGLVGAFSMVSGIDDAGGAIGFAWSFNAQYWATTRLSLRGGPAAILAFDPGFEDIGAEPGVAGAISYAVLKAGTFALDLRLDLIAGADNRFGSAGIGVNLN